MLNRIGIIGDIHTESERLEAVLNFFGTLALDRIVSVGDIVDGPGNVNQCCHLLKQNQVLTIQGNHDRWFLEDGPRMLKDATQKSDINDTAYQFIAQLPTTLTLSTCEGALLLCHGIDTNDMAKVLPEDYGYAIEANVELWKTVHSQKYRFMVNGHTHQRMVRTFDDLTIINAGSLKQEPCCGVVDFQQKLVQFYDIRPDFLLELSEQVSLLQ